ncbi:MAG: DUF454 family protein, partial [Salinivirgaceae bacterium]
MHKKILFLMALSLVVIAANAKDEPRDSVKTGLNLGALPTITYDSDFGLQYGAMVNFFFYGDGSTYPQYRHSIYTEMSRFTKGSGINRLFYDSKYLIPGVRLTADISYLTEKALPFYGFNGAEAFYNGNWENDQSDEYISRVFYRHERKLFRFKTDFQGKLPVKNWGWIAGYEAYNFQIGSVDIDQLNDGQASGSELPDTAGLYDLYVRWQMIDEDEKDGGTHHYVKGGIVYDTRDNEPNPMSGIWTEFVVQGAPGIFESKKYSHAKISFTHRQYFTLIPNDLALAVRILYQTTVGKSPFYLYPLISTSYLKGANSEGVGGAKTVRGVLRNRVVGKSIAFGNIELRYKLWRFHLLNQNFYIGTNLFTDAGVIVENIPYDRNEAIRIAPILPTTPFLLLAAFCYARSSEKFYIWLLTNRWFGE